jgi:uncharacterized RDD family membrane protein YckC
MKPRFEPDVDSSLRLPPPIRLIDPEAYDASEQQFAASVEEKPVPSRFVPDDTVQQPSSQLTSGAGSPQAAGDEMLPANSVPAEGIDLGTEGKLETVAQNAQLQSELLEPPDSDSWRRELADRVNNYRARRRPRAPRYPSLQLKFDPPEESWTVDSAASPPSPTAAPNRLAVAMKDIRPVPLETQPVTFTTNDATDRVNAAETSAKIIEFPHSPEAPLPLVDELAEPVVARPRILEVPELLIPPPALGGILMDPVEEQAQERRPGFELPLQAAPLSRRVWAGVIDGLLVITAFAVFACLFFRVTSIVPPLQQAAGISMSLTALFWAAYQYLMLVYTGTTPGLKLARLQLSRFDGAAVPRRIRRFRVLASMLSGLSLALGYAWCFLDEDRLCWHDRITRTYMAPKPPPAENR